MSLITVTHLCEHHFLAQDHGQPVSLHQTGTHTRARPGAYGVAAGGIGTGRHFAVADGADPSRRARRGWRARCRR